MMSAAMWCGIFWTILKIDISKFQPEVSEIKQPVAAQLSLAILN